jgi:hypothetical protein
MVKKWAEWRRENKDKRPRRKELTPLVDGIGEGPPSPAVSGIFAVKEAKEIKREGTEDVTED